MGGGVFIFYLARNVFCAGGVAANIGANCAKLLFC
jgi:hypothetical protein